MLRKRVVEALHKYGGVDAPFLLRLVTGFAVELGGVGTSIGGSCTCEWVAPGFGWAGFSRPRLGAITVCGWPSFDGSPWPVHYEITLLTVDSSALAVYTDPLLPLVLEFSPRC